MKPKETTKQLERALKHQDLDNVSRLVSIMSIEEINQACIAMEDEFWMSNHHIEHTPILFAIRENNLALLTLLLGIKGIQLTGTKTCESPLFLAIILNRTEMIPVLLKHPDINVNEIREPRVRGNPTTPISLAYGRPQIFSILLQATGIDIHIGIENPDHFIRYIQTISNGCDPEFITMPQLIEHYCDLLIKTPKKMSELFEQTPELLSFLVKNRSELLKALNKKVYSLEPAAYYTLLKTIVDSAHQKQSEQHPFYTVFSTPIHQSGPFGLFSTWFSRDQRSELEQLQQKVDVVERKQCAPHNSECLSVYLR